MSPRLPPWDEVDDQTSVEVVDKDDLLQGDGAGVVQLLHDGRLPLQVLGDKGVLDLVWRHHLQSHSLVQNGVVGHVQIGKGGWGQLVVAD